MHGWGGSIDSFLGVARYFSRFFRVTLVDFYGFGKTEHPSNPLNIDDYAESIAEIIRHYKMDSVSLVCHSFGGRVGIVLAHKYGYLIDRLVLTDSAGVLPRRGIRYYYRIYRHKILTKLGIKHRFGSEDYRKLSPIMKQTFKNIVNHDLSPLLNKITLPVLLIWGSKDTDTPIYMAKKMLRTLPACGLVVFKGAGHYAYLTELNSFCVIVRRFLEGDDNGMGDNSIKHNRRRSSIITLPCTGAKQ